MNIFIFFYTCVFLCFSFLFHDVYAAATVYSPDVASRRLRPGAPSAKRSRGLQSKEERIRARSEDGSSDDAAGDGRGSRKTNQRVTDSVSRERDPNGAAVPTVRVDLSDSESVPGTKKQHATGYHIFFDEGGLPVASSAATGVEEVHESLEAVDKAQFICDILDGKAGFEVRLNYFHLISELGPEEKPNNQTLALFYKGLGEFFLTLPEPNFFAAAKAYYKIIEMKIRDDDVNALLEKELHLNLLNITEKEIEEALGRGHIA
jgi:hypothetical protein